MDSHSPQDVYAKCLPKDRGYPLWFPEPSNTLPSSYRQDGLQIGDVGHVTRKGTFNVLLNICYGPNHALHQRLGVSFDFDLVESIDHQIEVISNADPPGCIIISPGITRPSRTLEREGHYEFTPSNAKGAILILPDGATSHDLLAKERFRQMAIEHAFDWYEIAKKDHGESISNNSLYLITGFYKARSWSLASFDDATGTESRNIKVVPREREGATTWREWMCTFPMRYRDGPGPDRNGSVNQTVFISGFKITVRDDVLGWMSPKPKVQPVPADWPRNKGHCFSRFLMQLFGKKTKATSKRHRRANGGAEIDDVPALSQPFHPSDIINRYLLNEDPDALVAITHDSEWITLIETGKLTPEELTQGDRLEEFLSEHCTLVSQPENSAVYIQGNSKDVSSSVFIDVRRTLFKAGSQQQVSSKLEGFWSARPFTDNFEVVITRIRTEDVVAGFRRMPVGFYVVVQFDTTKRRTENKPVCLHDEVVEWDDRIQLPFEPSTKVRLSVCASFEFSPTLGNGEILRTVQICVGDLLDNTHVVMFSPTQGEPLSPCSSLLITAERRRSRKSGAASDHDDDFDWEESSDLAQLTDQGHDALLRYRDDPRKEHIAASIGYFEQALSIHPTSDDHLCRAAALCNLARANFIQCQIDHSVELSTSISYYREALELRPVGRQDRPGTLLHLAEVLLYRYGKLGFEEFPGEIMALASEVQGSCSAHSHERRAADLALQTYALYKAISSCNLVDLEKLTLALRQAVEEVPRDYFDRLQRLTNLALTLWIRYEFCGNLDNLDESIAIHQEAMQFARRGLDSPIHTQLLKERANPTLTDFSWKDVLVTAASFVVPRFSIYRALCERLETLDRLPDTIDCFRQMVDELGEDTNLHGEWILEKLEYLGGTAAGAQRYDDAITLYTTALFLNPPSPQGILIKRSKAFVATGSWEQALGDADQVIALDPSSPWGYQMKHAALHKGREHQNAALAFEMMVSKIAQSTDPVVQRELSDLEDAISRQRDAVDLTPHGHSDKPNRLMSLASAFLARFERLGELSDLEDVISRQKDAVDLTPRGHPNKSSRLNSLASAFLTRFECIGDLSDLESATLMFRDAVNLAPHGHPDKPKCLSSLARASLTRFEHFGNLPDLEDAILMSRNAIDLAPHDYPDRPSCLVNLGSTFLSRFQRLGKLSDLEDAISMFRDAVELTPQGHTGRPSRLNSLASAFLARFERLGELSDLEDAVSGQRDAVDLTPYGHPGKSRCLSSLASAFLSRFQRLGKLSDLEEAISRLWEAVDLTPHGHPHKPRRLNNLGRAFLIRFERIGEFSDLEDAITRHRDAVDLTPYDHPDNPGHLNSLGSAFLTHFERIGELSDLEDAIMRFRDAVDLTPHGHPDNPGRLNNLGSAFRARFEHIGELNDLEDAITRFGDAVDLTPHGHPDKPGRLNNLGNAFLTRFERIWELSDLEDAITRFGDAVDLTPHGHPDKPGRLHNLGNAFLTRFERIGELSDLEDAITRFRDAVDLTPHGHPDKPGRLHNLGNAFLTRFERIGDPSDLEDAITRFRDAVDLTPDGHSDKPHHLNGLGHSLVARCERFRDTGDMEQAVSLYSHAASAFSSSIITRFRASQHWISCARQIHHHSLLHAYSVSISLLPQLAWIGLSLRRRYEELAQGVNMVREAAAAALDSGFPEIAVEWLEQGRSVVWGELFQLRSSYEELSVAHPDRASSLRELSVALEHAGATLEKSQGVEHHSIGSLQQKADRHRSLAIQRDGLLQEIRGLPGFEGFLLHKEFSQLRALAHSGPVVILNAAENRCDALIVLGDIDNVIHVPLSSFTFAQATGLQKVLKNLLADAHAMRFDNHEERWGEAVTPGGVSWESLLSTLWTGVAKSVLDALAISTPGELSRIFWCPTGPFVFLPIHAAGLYGTEYLQPGHKVSDFVISSYIPTLSILSLSSNAPAIPDGDLRLLAVRQPPSDGLSHLPGVAVELERIREIIRNHPPAQTTFLESSVGTVEEVLSLMKDTDWVHFSCHGIQDTADPTQSGLCLADRRRLKISDIIALSRPHGGLAFLSADETATGDADLPDEAIHMAAGMLFAGYGGVIGTMWSTSDEFAPHVTREVYTQLFQNGTRPDYREAARALHDAIGRLRGRRGVPFHVWVPYVHVGL